MRIRIPWRILFFVLPEQPAGQMAHCAGQSGSWGMKKGDPQITFYSLI